MILEIKYFNFIKIRITNYQLHNNISLVVVKNNNRGGGNTRQYNQTRQ